MSDKPLITIVTPCYNEEENVGILYQRIKDVIAELTQYRFNILFIDNASKDGTISELKALAAKDKSVKLILNARNFGHIRSPYYGILQSTGVATIYLASDLQDPPELIPEFISHWEKGYKLVMAVKPVTQGNRFLHLVRRRYYRLLDRITDVNIINDSTGFGLYDEEVINPYPFLRGLVAELGYPVKTVRFEQPRRSRGLSKNNIYNLYDIAWLGMVSHSKLPIRLAAFAGFFLGIISILAAMAFFILKLLFWEQIPLGVAPLVISYLFLTGVLFVAIGIVGEYVGTILIYVQGRPIVVERERINFNTPEED